jgi:hypothetical protein
MLSLAMNIFRPNPLTPATNSIAYSEIVPGELTVGRTIVWTAAPCFNDAWALA